MTDTPESTPEPRVINSSLKFAIAELYATRATLEYLAQFTPLGVALQNIDATITNLRGALELVHE